MTTLSIPDMTCGHCKASVEAALAPLVSMITVDLTARQVELQGAANLDTVLATLGEIGFPAQVVTK